MTFSLGGKLTLYLREILSNEQAGRGENIKSPRLKCKSNNFCMVFIFNETKVIIAIEGMKEEPLLEEVVPWAALFSPKNILK